jgi:hypothetical protein
MKRKPSRTSMKISSKFCDRHHLQRSKKRRKPAQKSISRVKVRNLRITGNLQKVTSKEIQRMKQQKVSVRKKRKPSGRF